MSKERFSKVGTLSSLDYMPKQVAGWTASSRSAAMRCLLQHRVCWAAGDLGSVTIWKGKDGRYRGDFQRFGVRLGYVSADKKSYLTAWLATWWPAMDCTDALKKAMNGGRK